MEAQRSWISMDSSCVRPPDLYHVERHDAFLTRQLGNIVSIIYISCMWSKNPEGMMHSLSKTTDFKTELEIISSHTANGDATGQSTSVMEEPLRYMKNSVYDIYGNVSPKQFPGFSEVVYHFFASWDRLDCIFWITSWLECIQERNEIIFVPSGWYHQVKNLGKEDDSNIPTFDQPEKPEEHEDGGGDHIIHDDDVDDGEMDHEEKFCDEEDDDPDSYDKPKDTINEDVWDPFPIVPQTQYSGYDDLAREDVDKNDDHNEDYEGSDKNPNKEEDHKHEIFGEENPNENPNEDISKRLEGKENYSKDEDTNDKQLDQEYEGDDLEYKEIDHEPNISDDEGFITNNKEETDKMFILEDTISINHNWFNACNLSWVWNLLVKDYNETKEYIEDIRSIADDFESLCQRNLAANTGLWLHFNCIGMNFDDFFIFATRMALVNLTQLVDLMQIWEIRHGKNCMELSAVDKMRQLLFNLVSICNVVRNMESIDYFHKHGKNKRNLEYTDVSSSDVVILKYPNFKELYDALEATYRLLHTPNVRNSNMDLVDGETGNNAPASTVEGSQQSPCNKSSSKAQGSCFDDMFSVLSQHLKPQSICSNLLIDGCWTEHCKVTITSPTQLIYIIDDAIAPLRERCDLESLFEEWEGGCYISD
eukprot:Gb_12476 [translate_table: standard]